MTRKPTLERWANGLGANLPASATVPELEQAIESAIHKPAEPQYSLREGVANNWAVIRSEVPATVRAIAQNLRG